MHSWNRVSEIWKPDQLAYCRATSNRSVAGSWAAPHRGGEGQAGREASDRTRLVQHFGPHAEDVEHMGERYVDDQMPGAVQVPRCEDPRPRFACTSASCNLPLCQRLCTSESDSLRVPILLMA